MKIIVTGGAGFIGSALVRHLIAHTEHDVLVLDKLTYAGNLASLAAVQETPALPLQPHRHLRPCRGGETLCRVQPGRGDASRRRKPRRPLDRCAGATSSTTNVVGTYTLLEVALAHWRRTRPGDPNVRFHHVSTDEVYGALADDDPPFLETTRYDPRSPYSATKAASDHLVRAWHHTFGLPIVLTNCSNNYGPHQFVEKLIPLTILKCLAGEPIPVYGRGANVRDWLYVDDHAEALTLVLEKGRAGRDLQHRRQCRAPQHRRRHRNLRGNGQTPPASKQRLAPRLHQLRRRPARARFPLRH